MITNYFQFFQRTSPITVRWYPVRRGTVNNTLNCRPFVYWQGSDHGSWAARVFKIMTLTQQRRVAPFIGMSLSTRNQKHRRTVERKKAPSRGQSERGKWTNQARKPRESSEDQRLVQAVPLLPETQDA